MTLTTRFASALALALLGACNARVDEGPTSHPEPVAPDPRNANVQTIASTAGMSAMGSPMRIAVSKHDLFFTTYTGGEVARVPITGGTPVTLAGNSVDFPFGVAVDGAYVYWSCYETQKVLRVPFAGGEPEIVGTAGYPSDLTVVDAHVYVATVAGPMDMPIGGEALLLTADADGAQSVAAAGSTVVWSNFSGGLIREVGAPVSVPVIESWAGAPPPAPAPTAPTTLAARRRLPNRVATDGVNVYWVEGDTGYGVVASVPIHGGDVKILSSEPYWAEDIAVDASGVYWTDPNAKTITKLAHGATTPVVIAANEKSPWAIALDDANVYWSTMGDDATSPEIRRMPK